jgi:hypothetical protein
MRRYRQLLDDFPDDFRPCATRQLRQLAEGIPGRLTAVTSLVGHGQQKGAFR